MKRLRSEVEGAAKRLKHSSRPFTGEAKGTEVVKPSHEEAVPPPEGKAPPEEPPSDDPPGGPKPPRRSGTEPGIPIPELPVDVEAETVPAMDAAGDPSTVLVDPPEYSSIADEIFNQGVTVFQPEVALAKNNATAQPIMLPNLEPQIIQPIQPPDLYTHTTTEEMGPPVPIHVQQMNAWNALSYWKEISTRNILLNPAEFRAQWLRIPVVLSEHLGVPVQQIATALRQIEARFGLRNLDSNYDSSSTRFDLALRGGAGRVYISAMIRSLYTGEPVPAAAKLISGRQERLIRSSISRTQKRLVDEGLLAKPTARPIADICLEMSARIYSGRAYVPGFNLTSPRPTPSLSFTPAPAPITLEPVPVLP
jgi:hypothetical protein